MPFNTLFSRYIIQNSTLFISIFLHHLFFFSYNNEHVLDYTTSTNVDKTSSIRAKAKAEFLENLNQKLAKQSLSGRAFAVRNLINSKAMVSKMFRKTFLQKKNKNSKGFGNCNWLVSSRRARFLLYPQLLFPFYIRFIIFFFLF